MTTSHDVPPARRSGRKTRAQWAKIARGFQRQTVKGLIGLGKTLTEAKRDLDAHGEWLPFLRDDLKMDVRFAQRVMMLARNPRFSKASNLTHLPSALSALGELAKVPEDAFEAGIKSGAISPSTTAQQARKLTVVTTEPPNKVVVQFNPKHEAREVNEIDAGEVLREAAKDRAARIYEVLQREIPVNEAVVREFSVLLDCERSDKARLIGEAIKRLAAAVVDEGSTAAHLH